MKRFLWYLLTVTLLISLFSGCSGMDVVIDSDESTDTKSEMIEPEITEPPETEPKLTVDDILISALKGYTPVVTEYNKTEPLTTYLAEQYFATADAYAFVDFDQDGQNEIITMTTSSNASYIVLHYDSETVYAYSFGFRSMMGLTQEGFYTGSNGATGYVYLSLNFSGGRCAEVELAKVDNFGTDYEVEGRKCSKAEFDAYTAKLNEGEPVSWDPVSSLYENGIFAPAEDQIFRMEWRDQSLCTGDFIFAADGTLYVAIGMGLELISAGIGSYTINENRLTLDFTIESGTAVTVSYIYIPSTEEIVQISSTGLAYSHSAGDSFSFQQTDAYVSVEDAIYKVTMVHSGEWT